MTSLYLNPLARAGGFRGLFTDDEYREVREYFAEAARTASVRAPARFTTPLRRLTAIARDLGLAEVYAKDETARFGLNAFKIVGVSYAMHRLGDERLSRGVVCATAGNHGRGVARACRDKRVPCTVFVPAPGSTEPLEHTTRQSRVDAMRADGANVIDVDGTYEEAVREAAAFGERTGATIISDTSWPGYDEIPRLIMAGYTHILQEASEQWDAPAFAPSSSGEASAPTHVIVQGGVGGLVCAAASWFAHRFGGERPYFIAAEPENAACLLQSAKASQPVKMDGNLDTIMAGLRCAEPSPVAWPAIAAGVDAFVSIPDAATLEAMQMMKNAPADERIDAGPSGACGLAALVSLMRAPELAENRSAAGLNATSRALVIVTEGT